MTITTLRFSDMLAGGDLATDNKTPGLKDSENVLFNNPSPNLAPGSNGDRPSPDPEMYYRLRFNSTLERWEYYSAAAVEWIQLEQSVGIQDFPFLIYKPEAQLPFAFDLGTLTTGLLKQTVIAGESTPSIAVNGTDYYGPGMTGYLRAPLGIADASGNPIITTLTSGALATNWIAFVNSVSGDPVICIPQGSDPNIKLAISSKGTSPITFQTEGNTYPFSSGTAYNHTTNFVHPTTTGSQTVTWQDASGTVAYLSDITGFVESVTGATSEILVDNTDPSNPIVGLDPVLIAPGSVQVGNLYFSGNTIDTLTGDLSLSPASTGKVLIFSEDPNNPLIIYNGTGSLHQTFFNFANTANARTVTFQDANGTVAFLSDIPGSIVNSITGTANQVLANGTTGSPQSGSVTLTLPQSIATSSSPEFANISLNNGDIKGPGGTNVIAHFTDDSPLAVNYIDINNSATGDNVYMSARGSDLNIGMSFFSKNQGNIEWLSQLSTNAFKLYSGTAYQHITALSFSNTNTTRNVTFQDADGTLAFLGDIPTNTLTTVFVQTFTVSGTYTPSTDMKFCIVQVLAGGGAGGGAPTASAITGCAAGGGGSGGYAIGIFTAADIGVSQTIDIGDGGIGSANANGGNGTASAIGTLIKCDGGVGGQVAGTAIGTFGGVLGGSGGPIDAGGYSHFPGSPGLNSVFFGTANAISGSGANSQLSGGAQSVRALGASIAGNNAVTGSGAGGSGAAIQGVVGANTAGGNGGSGLVIITEFI